ncbi:MAG: ABC transporter substrate binding protein, partial [Desulfobaccales bacterium]
MWLAVFLPLFWAVPAAARPNHPSILIIHSYHYGYAWSDNELSGLLARLRQSYPEIEPAIEYMDAKRFSGPDQMDRMRDYLAGKYRGKKIDLVIVLDNPALDLALHNRREIFPNVPLVFAGISDFTPAMLKGQEKVTGVSEVQDIIGTLNLALALQPHAKEVLVIHDYTDTGRAIRKEIDAALPALKGKVKVSFTPRATFPEILKQLNSLPPESLGLITGFATDSRGESLGLAESTRLLASSKVPLYAMHKTRLGHGIVGGMLLGGREQGRMAGEIACKILAGEDPSHLPVVTRSTSLPMFDYRQLTRFNIPLASLPADSIIINRPLPFYEKYKYLTFALSWTIAFLVLMVASLSLAIIRQRRAQARLTESEARYRHIVDTAEEGIWSLDQNSCTTFVNHRMAAMLGYTPGEMLGQPVSVYIFAEDLADQREKYEQLQQGRICRYERRFKCKDGSEVWAQISATPLLDASGRFQGGFAMLTDITTRKQAEIELKLKEKMLDGASDSIFLQDLDGNFIYVNEAAYTSRGYKKEELLKKNVVALITPEMVQIREELLKKLQDKGEFISESMHLRNDGSVIPVEVHASLIDVDGRRLILSVVRDITERKQAEEALRETSEALQALIQASPLGIFVLDPEGRVRLWNEASERIFGWSAAEALGQVLPIVPEDKLPEFRDLLQQALDGKPLIGMEVRRRKKDGTRIDVRTYTATLYDQQGQVTGVMALVADITLQKQAEKALRESEELYHSLFEN